MKKLLLICSAVTLFYGDCAWGMDDIDPWKGTSSSGSDQFNAESARESGSPVARSRRNSRQFNAESSRDSSSPRMKSRRNSRENVRVSHQNESVQNEQTQANSRQFEENRFIKDDGYRQYHYVPLNNSKMGRATPTNITTVSGDLRGWNDISEIRYANDVSYDKLENPKVILYRNRDNSCYIILRIGENKHGVFYGINERNIEVGRNSFSVYDLSEDIGSFTDNVSRLIYVDESGLYFVPKAENSVEDVTDIYKKEGKFKFKGSVIKVSAIDGTITLDGEIITKENFFDNWVKEDSKTVLSTKRREPDEIIRNFYPPEGSYKRIYGAKYESSGNTSSGWLNAHGVEIKSGFGSVIVSLSNKNWLNLFINKRVSIVKSKNKIGAAELVHNGTFSSILAAYNDKIWDSRGKDVDNADGYNQAVRNAIATQVAVRKGRTTSYNNKNKSASISEMVKYNSALFKNPDFVRKLKPAFKELEKDYEHNKESEMWIPFEIVGNL